MIDTARMCVDRAHIDLVARGEAGDLVACRRGRSRVAQCRIDEAVIPGTAIEMVEPSAAGQLVDASAPGQGVGSAFAAQHVVARIAGEPLAELVAGEVDGSRARA